MFEFLHFFGWFLILLGAFFTLTAALGVIKLPDFFTRLHAASICDSLGAPLIIIGVFFLEDFAFFSWKMVILIILLFITGPTSTHALVKSAFLYGLKPGGGGKNNDNS